ncbi:sugar efflux transporter [Flindersiella endophytica]
MSRKTVDETPADQLTLRTRSRRAAWIAGPLPGLLAAVLLLGVADSITGPYLVLFGADQARLSPLAIGTFVSVTGLSGMVISTWLGRRYDRNPSRRPLLLAVSGSAVGYLLLTQTTSFPVLLVIGAVFLGTGAAAFPQLFALARSHLDRGGRTERATPALRSMWSMAWAVGPMAGGAILAAYEFDGLFLAAAICFALVAVPLLPLRVPRAVTSVPRGTHQSEPGRPKWLVPLVVASFALFHTAMFAGSVALPLYVTDELDRPYGDVGLMFSVCAIVEFVAALALTRMPAHVNRERVILLGFLLFLAYFALIAVSSSVWLIVAAQAARGTAISVVLALGITYFHDLLPRQPGRATTLLSNTAVAGSLVAGILAGATAEALGFRAALILCGVLCAIGWLLLIAARTCRNTPTRNDA